MLDYFDFLLLAVDLGLSALQELLKLGVWELFNVFIFGFIDRRGLRKKSIEHFRNTIGQERSTPSQDVHIIGQLVRLGQVGAGIELLDRQGLVVTRLRDSYGGPVLIGATVVRRRENGDDQWEGILTLPKIHVVAFLLNFMGSDQSKQSILS